ncbi:phage tail fiber protein [Citrobacter freundii]|uniref:phage tail fiber protein n=1 Tax=Citrobacter freundii TaxID=546 RepID=UPI0039784123
MRPLMPPVQTPDNLFHDGNPLTGELGTIVDAEHLNNEQDAIRDTQSELIAILTAAAMAPESTAGQLLSALNKLYAPNNDTLGALASLVGAANKLPYFTAANTAALTALSSIGRDIISKASIADVLTYLKLGNAAKLDVGSNPGDVVTAGSDQPVYNSTLPTSGYTSTDPSGYMGKATFTGGDTLVRLIGLIARNVAGNWTLVNSYGSHFGTGGSIQPEDAAHVLVSTDGAGYTRRWYFYNNGTLRGPSGDFGDMAWVNNKVGTVDGVIILGKGINVKKVAIPDLPLLGYTDTSSRGILATATGQADSVTKAYSIQLTKPGAGGWGLTMSWGTYVGASGSVDDVAHLLCASDGAAFSRRWWLYNNGELVGPGGKFYSEKNTIRTADGTLKAASPVVKIFRDGRFETNAESEGASVERLAVGEYLIKGCKGLNADAAWGGIDGGFDVPVDRNKQPLVWLDYMVNADGSVLVKTYHRTHPDAPVFARNEIDGKKDGDPVDIPADQFVSVRLQMMV